MSIELIENEIKAFLSTGLPEVICITGKWGVGKTFAWNRYLTEAIVNKKVSLPHYAYVSLFGINSLDELKYSIFENSVSSADVGIEASLETLQSNTSAALKRLGRKSLGFLQQTPALKTYLGGLGPAWFLSVKATVVCIDDIERCGQNLAIRDVLGLISQLKERKGCKVALILNDEGIKETDRAEFRLFFEKVVDTSLKFEPSAQESVRIALDPNSNSDRLIGQNCVSLGISNIRVIKKIQRLVRKVDGILTGFLPQITTQAIHSLTLMGWSVYEPAIAPSLKYIQRRGSVDLLLGKEKKLSPQEVSWNSLLGAYSFGAIDELDAALLSGLESGYFDVNRLRKQASIMDHSLRTQTLDNTFFKAWEMYHDSFDNNEREVLDLIYQSFMANAGRISPNNANGTVVLFKEVGRKNQAAEMIERYIESRPNDRSAFDLANEPFGADVTDPDLLQGLTTKYKEFKDERPLRDILISIAQQHGWSREDLTTLSMVSVEEYYSLFKSAKGEELRRVINACLQFDTIQNASEEMKEIPKRAKEALTRIGGESAINARRVRKYGIKLVD
jgi:hypothetical protein